LDFTLEINATYLSFEKYGITTLSWYSGSWDGYYEIWYSYYRDVVFTIEMWDEERNNWYTVFREVGVFSKDFYDKSSPPSQGSTKEYIIDYLSGSHPAGIHRITFKYNYAEITGRILAHVNSYSGGFYLHHTIGYYVIIRWEGTVLSSSSNAVITSSSSNNPHVYKLVLLIIPGTEPEVFQIIIEDFKNESQLIFYFIISLLLNQHIAYNILT